MPFQLLGSWVEKRRRATASPRSWLARSVLVLLIVTSSLSTAEAGKSDRDAMRALRESQRQALRESRRQERFERRQERQERQQERQQDRQIAREQPQPAAAGRESQAAATGPAAIGPATSAPNPASSSRPTAGPVNRNGEPRARRNPGEKEFIDDDGDGAPDTLADLVKVLQKKAATPPPPPSLPVLRDGKARIAVPEAGTAAPGTLADLLSTGGKREAGSPAPMPQAASPVAPPRETSRAKPSAPAPTPVPPVAVPTAAAATAVVTVPASAPPVAAAPTSAPGSSGWSGKIQRAGTGMGSNLQLPDLPARPNEVLAVGLTPGAAARARQLGFEVQQPEHLSSLGMVLSRLIVPRDVDPRQALSMLQAGGDTTTLALNKVYRSVRLATEEKSEAPGTTGDLDGRGCSAARCYGAAAINWHPSLSSCAKRVKVGVIDTGIDVAHPAFGPKPVQVGTLHAKPVGSAAATHGTGVLAVMAGASGSSTPGLIPDADFYAADIFYADGSGAPISDTAHLLRALDWMEAWKVRVINLSLTGPPDNLVEAAIARLTRNGVLVVAAAGNDGPGAPPAYPAAYPQVIAVTAVNRDRRAYRQANHGDYIDVAAPGVDIWTALPNSRQGSLSGTSLAAPFVAAILAGLYNQLPEKTKAAALSRLRYHDLGQAGRDKIYGNGLVIAPTTCAPGAVVADRPAAPAAPEAATDQASAWSWGAVTRPASTVGFR